MLTFICKFFNLPSHTKYYSIGRNHVLMFLSRGNLSPATLMPELTGRAIIAQSMFTHQLFRQGFDLVVPPVLGPPGGDVWGECAPQLPARRKYLLSFQGHQPISPLKTHGFNGQFNQHCTTLHYICCSFKSFIYTSFLETPWCCGLSFN